MKCPYCDSTRIAAREVGKSTGAVVGGAAGTATGIAGAGSEVGERLDHAVLDNRECLDCGHTFKE